MKQPKTIKEFLDQIGDKSIHIVGVTGAEGSSILRLLSKYNIKNIVLHDFLASGSVEKSFKLWHKGLTKIQRQKKYKQFRRDIEKYTFNTKNLYLKGITSADIIFVPQSWRLYRLQNKLLFQAYQKNIPFISITKLYLDFAQCTIVAVTGTVGKGSVASGIYQLLKNAGKKVFFAGNETWSIQLADKLDQMRKSDFLVIEVSHRQLEDGFNKAPEVVVYTNIYPNHLDEVSWQKYKSLKFSFARKQTKKDITVINYDNQALSKISEQAISKVLYYSEKDKKKNIKNIHNIFNFVKSNKSEHYLINLLAAVTTASILGVSNDVIKKSIAGIKPLPARLQLLNKVKGIRFYNDIKSTTPWATLKGVEKLKPNVILILGGRTKGINYDEFAKKIIKTNCFIIVLKSQLSNILRQFFPKERMLIKNNLTEAVLSAFKIAKKNDKILVSPAASYFYSDFIKRKRSLKKIISLLLKEQVLWD